MNKTSIYMTDLGQILVPHHLCKNLEPEKRTLGFIERLIGYEPPMPNEPAKRPKNKEFWDFIDAQYSAMGGASNGS